MVGGKVRYDEIARVKVGDNKNVVISSCSRGGYTIAQQLAVKDGKVDVNVFLKGAIHIKDKKALVGLRDALNIAIQQDEGWEV